jgi:hypothetical protein
VIWRLGDEYEKIASGYRRKYWRCGLCQKSIFPSLHLYAFDTLAIPAMSVECEIVFSSTKKLITPERNRLAEEIIEASECLKNWWDRGLIQQLEEEEAI